MSDTDVTSATGMAQSAGLDAVASTRLSLHPATRYKVECVRNGAVVWTEEFNNIVVTAGRNKLLDATLKTGYASPAWYVGLKATGTVLAADTMGSHSGWAELGADTYSNVTRPAFTPGSVSAGSVDNSASKAVFTINATQTVFGCFMADSSTVDGTSGILFGAGDFGASRAVQSGDTLNVTLTVSLS